MQLNILQIGLPENQQEKLAETSEIIGKSLQELRGLAKSLNPETIKNNGLVDSLTLEIERFNRLKVIDASLNIINEPFNLSNEKEIILFRILQEFCNNSLKYSKAKNLDISLNFNSNSLMITAKDNGVGFNVNATENHTGIGLLNMKSRGKLIGADIHLESSANKGTKLYISCLK